MNNPITRNEFFGVSEPCPIFETIMKNFTALEKKIFKYEHKNTSAKFSSRDTLYNEIPDDDNKIPSFYVDTRRVDLTNFLRIGKIDHYLKDKGGFTEEDFHYYRYCDKTKPVLTKDNYKYIFDNYGILSNKIKEIKYHEENYYIGVIIIDMKILYNLDKSSVNEIAYHHLKDLAVKYKFDPWFFKKVGLSIGVIVDIGGDETHDIPPEFFYSYKIGNLRYCADIRTAYANIKSGNIKNPYTNVNLPKNVIDEIKTLYTAIKEKSEETVKTFSQLMADFSSKIPYLNDVDLYKRATQEQIDKFIEDLTGVFDESTIDRLNKGFPLHILKEVLIKSLLEDRGFENKKYTIRQIYNEHFSRNLTN
jgi:hypothetical protein